ncbi:hypothetical protein MLD38_027559 [Melastoma candidum]|uniref:Uncharacterized protein n=1 Tax=Melastoma candidum TaxID=119954 RepID=A0ACB9P4T9_9MYRT|nr:hypothetical protein MLD38_027559 [Melastoma candidum]
MLPRGLLGSHDPGDEIRTRSKLEGYKYSLARNSKWATDGPFAIASPSVISTMVEQQKENALVDRKEKKMLLEEDIGKEFLTSWKSMSVTGDDPMDFNFDTVGKSKKAFDFDKLDMDFSLDSPGFDKLPSFDVELPELDFSSSSRNCHQDKGKTEEGSLNNCGGRKDSFSFSFDYSELDALDFGTSREKREGMEHKCRDNQVASPLTVESHFFKTNGTKAPISVGMDANSNKLSPSKNSTAEMEISVPLRGPNSSRAANPVHTSLTSGSSCLGKEVGNSTEKLAVLNATEDESSRFFRKSLSEATFFTPSIEDNANISGCGEGKPSHASSALVSDSVRKQDARDTNFPKDKEIVTDNGKAELDMQDSAPATRSNLRHHSTDRGPDVEKVVPVSKHNDCQDVSSKFYKMPGATVPESHLDSLLGEQHRDITCKELSPKSVRSGRNDGILLSGRKSICSLGFPSKELTKGHNEVLEVQKLYEKSTKVGLNSSTVTPNMSGPTLRDHSDATPSQSQIDAPSKSSLTSCLLPNMSQTVASMLTSRFDKADVDKVGSTKSEKNSRVLSSLRNLRTLKPGEDQLRSIAPKKNLLTANSLQKTDQNNSERGVARGASPQKPPLVNLSLKRKDLEVANDDSPSFHPQKRLSESPTEKGSFKVSSERVLGKEVNDIEIYNTCPSSHKEAIGVTDSFQENQEMLLLTDIATRAELSLTCETNSNVCRAEAYTKELEDICDLLRKKQEEAKELLVRALVNNNNLLLLNRPIYDKKILAVQKFAAELMSKQLAVTERASFWIYGVSTNGNMYPIPSKSRQSLSVFFTINLSLASSQAMKLQMGGKDTLYMAKTMAWAWLKTNLPGSCQDVMSRLRLKKKRGFYQVAPYVSKALKGNGWSLPVAEKFDEMALAHDPDSRT